MVRITSVMIALALCIAAHGQTIEQVRAELIRQNVPHHNIVLAQARLESGNMKSGFYKRTNNLFAMKRDKHSKYGHWKGYATYSHWRESIADYKARISSRYKGGNYYSFLMSIKYAEDKEYINKLKQF